MTTLAKSAWGMVSEFNLLIECCDYNKWDDVIILSCLLSPSLNAFTSEISTQSNISNTGNSLEAVRVVALQKKKKQRKIMLS